MIELVFLLAKIATKEFEMKKFARTKGWFIKGVTRFLVLGVDLNNHTKTQSLKE